jgi:hypothetical protein
MGAEEHEWSKCDESGRHGLLNESDVVQEVLLIHVRLFRPQMEWTWTLEGSIDLWRDAVSGCFKFKADGTHERMNRHKIFKDDDRVILLCSFAAMI